MAKTMAPRIVPLAFAGQLADLESVRLDLETVVMYCDALQPLVEKPSGEFLATGRGLWEAALNRLGRTAGNGVGFTATSRNRFVPPREWVPEELREAYDYFLWLRDEHIAHAVSDFESVVARVHVAEPPAPPEVGGVGVHHARVEGPTTEMVIALKGVAQAQLAELENRIRDEKIRLVERIRSIPVQDVYAWPEDEAFRPTGSERPSSAKRGVARAPKPGPPATGRTDGDPKESPK